ncbi:MAG: type II secretion system secretin GspD [Planctomycetota bacterium]
MKNPSKHRLFATARLLAAVLAAAPLLAQDQPADPLAPANPAEVEEAGLLINFSDVPLATVLDHLSEEAGLIVVNEIELEGRVSVVSRQPMSVREAVDLLNTVLMDEGYAAVLRGRLLKVVTLEDVKSQSIPVRSGNDPSVMGESDRVITQIIPIRYAEAAGIAEDLGGLIDRDYAELTANDSSNSLIVTDTEANVKRITQIVQALDLSIAQVTELRVFKLQYADAADTARLIEESFDQAPSVEDEVNRVIQQRFSRGRGGGGGGGDDDRASGTSRNSTVSASADERTNSVVVSASPEIMETIAQIIEDLDSDTTAKESVLIYAVKNMQASELATIFNDLFESSTSSTQVGGQNRTGGQNGPGARVQAANAAAATNNDGAADLVGQVSAVASEDTNTLLILSPEKNFEQLTEILTELDRPVPQVLIRVIISEVSYDDSLDLGVEFEAINIGSTTNDNLRTNFNLFESTLGLNYLLFDGGNFSMALRALEATGKFDVLSRPYLLTADNQEASITVGQEVPFVTNSRITDEGNTVNTIEYREIGIILSVTPQINSEGLVVLDLRQELSNLTDRTIPISDEFNGVVINQRNVETQVAVGNGQTVVIGGLMEDQKQETISKVPWLGDIPLLGNLFRRTEQNDVKTELLVFLTPEVINDPRGLTAATDRVRDESEGLREQVEPGQLQQHLDRLQLIDPGGGDTPIEQGTDEPAASPVDGADAAP